MITLFAMLITLAGLIGWLLTNRSADRSMLELEAFLRSVASPFAGLFAVGQNGAKVLLKVNVGGSGGDDFVFLTGQTNLTINDTTNQIDVSDKLSGRLGERVPGRATASISVDVNFLRTDEVLSFMKTEYRNRRQIAVTVFDRDNLDAIEQLLSAGSIEGTDIESCEGIITNLTETHPDQDKSTLTLEIALNNDWVPAASA